MIELSAIVVHLSLMANLTSHAFEVSKPPIIATLAGLNFWMAVAWGFALIVRLWA